MHITEDEISELLERDRQHNCGEHADICVSLAGIADLPSVFGDFQR